MKFNIKREYTEEVDLELPVCFVEEKEYFKTVYLLTNIDNNKFEGINVNFFREEKKSNWYFTGIRKGMIFEDISMEKVTLGRQTNNDLFRQIFVSLKGFL